MSWQVLSKISLAYICLYWRNIHRLNHKKLYKDFTWQFYLSIFMPYNTCKVTIIVFLFYFIYRQYDVWFQNPEFCVPLQFHEFKQLVFKYKILWLLAWKYYFFWTLRNKIKINLICCNLFEQKIEHDDLPATIQSTKRFPTMATNIIIKNRRSQVTVSQNFVV